MSRFSRDILARALAFARPEAATVPSPTSAVDICAELCRRFEGFYPSPYLCPAGVPTIGFGATYYADGRRVSLSDPPISREAAERLLLLQIERVYLPAVLRLCPKLAYESPGRLGAILDFCFNLGSGNLSASTLRRKINEGDWAAVPAELRKWVRAKGIALKGLILRREAEILHV